MSDHPRILVVDDEEFVRDSIAEILIDAGLDVSTAGSADAAAAALRSQAFDALITDLAMPDGDGITLVADAHRDGVAIPMLVLTGVGGVDDAVAAMKAGAFDFLQKPVEPGRLVRLVRHAIQARDLESEVTRLRRTVEGARAEIKLIGESAPMREVRRLIDRVAPSNAAVLITGESGTGKELAAEAVHRASPRATGPLIRVNCAAIPESLFEAEFFGHRKGSFSGATEDRRGRFAEADGGTLVLDEIGTMKPDMQAKLLRVLESGEFQVVGESAPRTVDVRAVAVTNENLAARVEEGLFRADLFYRLNVFPVEMPPLRDHKEDIADIASHILGAIVPVDPPHLDADALEVLRSYDWPGNVRELRNVLERAAILAGEAAPDASLFRGLIESAPGRTATAADEFHLRDNLDHLERDLIRRALERTGNKKKEAAELLGIDRKNLGYYLRKHGLTDDAAGKDSK